MTPTGSKTIPQRPSENRWVLRRGGGVSLAICTSARPVTGSPLPALLREGTEDNVTHSAESQCAVEELLRFRVQRNDDVPAPSGNGRRPAGVLGSDLGL